MSLSDSSTTMGKTIKLRDGRMLGYAEFGDPEGKPVFHFHGFPGSRLEAEHAGEAVAKAGVRLIGIDRPGMGLSDFQPGRRILDWPDDVDLVGVVELANALEINRFAVVGVSGGGPYAAACAFKIPDRLTACGIIAGVGPYDLGTEGMMKSNRVLFFVSRRLPWLFGLLLWGSMGRYSQDAEKLEKMFSKGLQRLPEPDRKLAKDPEIKRLFIRQSVEAFRQGTKGPTLDGKLSVQPWGFKLEDISLDRVYLWHGELDVNVPIAMGRFMADAIPNCQAKFYPHEAHLSAALNHMDEIMEVLAS
jgi:pimeloyl-ACP methyl ester carboxylesterase